MCRIEVKVLLSGIRLSLLHLLHLAYLAAKHSHLYGLYNKCTAYNQETIFLIFIFFYHNVSIFAVLENGK